MSRTWLIGVSVVAHAAVAAGLFVSGVWHIERVEAHVGPTYLTQPPPPPPPPPGGAIKGAVKPDPNQKPKLKPHPDKIVQIPDKRPDETVATTSNDPRPESTTDSETVSPCLENCGPPAPPVAAVCGNGSRELGEQCDDGNTAGGDGCSATCTLEPKPAPRVATIGTNVLQGLRMSGDTQIQPSSSTQSMMIHNGDEKVHGTVKLCISTDGAVSSATMHDSTRYRDYDATLLSAVQGWRYRPYSVNGVAVPACSMVSFIYTIR